MKLLVCCEESQTMAEQWTEYLMDNKEAQT